MLISTYEDGQSFASVDLPVRASYGWYYCRTPYRYLVEWRCCDETMALYYGYHAYAHLDFV